MSEVALQAGSCYNDEVHIVVPSQCWKHSKAWANLIRRLIMDTLPPHAQIGNLISIPSTPGIYKITCTANKKIYVGSAVNLRKRKNLHWCELRQSKHGNQYLQNAWNKYSEQSFTFEVIELILLPEMVIAREQYWLNKLQPFGRKGFNIAREAGSTLGVKRSPETIEKNRRSHLGQISHNRGKIFSPETREKISQSHLGKKHTPEHIENARLAHIGLKRSPEAIEKQRQKLCGRKQSPEVIEKRIQPHRGKKRSPKAVENIKQAQQLRRERERKEKLTWSE